MAEAITAGCRVAGVVAPVASFKRLGTVEGKARAAKVSPCKFWESVKAMPCQPSRSAIWASAAARPTVGNVPSQNSAMEPPADFLGHSAGVLRTELVAR